MSNEYEIVTKTHHLYKTFQPRWQYLLNSFLGGEVYRRAQYLTQYLYESQSDYIKRLETTPYDNHCRGVISVYNAFLFRTEPVRNMGSLDSDASVESFMADADLEGRSLSAFLKDSTTYAGVFGHTFIMLSKPNTNARTRAEELAQDLRPYVSLITPPSVLDWKWERNPNGVYYLSYFKHVEEADTPGMTVIKEWTEQDIITTIVDDQHKTVSNMIVEPNQLGVIPVIIQYAQRSPMRGIGMSLIDDIADYARAIYNENSEIEQAIRISGHPSLVKTADTEAVAGAGAIVQMPDNLDPGLRPFLLEPSQTNITAIYTSIQHRIEAIDRMANIGGVRANQTRTMSGAALQTEFQMLNSRLSELADNIELTEDNLWSLWAKYQATVWDGTVDYPDDFNIQDTGNQLLQLLESRKIVTDPEYIKMLEHEIMEINLGEEDLEEYMQDPSEYAPPAPAQVIGVSDQEETASGRTYPDGEAIPDSLPPAYQPADSAEVPQGQNCGNCEYYNPDQMYCSKFNAPVRAVYWCAVWEPIEE